MTLKPAWILTILLAAGGCTVCNTLKMPDGSCMPRAEFDAMIAAGQAKDRADYASVTQTINPNAVVGCRSLGVVPGQNELREGVTKAARMGANFVLMGSQSAVTEGPYYDNPQLPGQPSYYTHTYVAMEAYACPATTAAAR